MMIEDKYLNCSSSTIGAQLLSIPPQQPDPPKHSTPKKGGDTNSRPQLDESSIIDEFASISYTDHKKEKLVSEKDRIEDMFNNELKKRASSLSSLKETTGITMDTLNRRITRDELPTSSRDTTNSAAALSTYRGKMAKFETPFMFRPQSSASDADTLASSSRRNLLGVERKKDQLNFCFVPLGKSLVLRLKVWNCDSVQMRIQCDIQTSDGDLSENPNFKIIEVSAPIMEPGMPCEISVQYTPTGVERNSARLVVERTNCDQFRYSFPLNGHGGIADFRLTEKNFDEGIAFLAASSQVIVVKPDMPRRFFLEFENRGQRPSFVYLLPISVREKSLPKVSIQPEQFVLWPYENEENRPNKMNILVEIKESLNLTSDHAVDSNVLQKRASLSTGKRFINSDGNRQREGCGTAGGNGRESDLLSSASSSASQMGYAFRIEAYWGEECQRQRLKCLELIRKREAKVDGIRFTGRFTGERQLGIPQRQKMNVTDNDLVDFRNSLRKTTLNIVDAHAHTYCPAKLEAASPLIKMYKDQSRLLKEVCPGEDSYNVSSMSTFLIHQ